MSCPEHSKSLGGASTDLTMYSFEKEGFEVFRSNLQIQGNYMERLGLEAFLPCAENYLTCSGNLIVPQVQTFRTSCTLYKLPLEITDKILELTLVSTGKTPAMLVALRQEPSLYYRALRIFRYNNVFEFEKEEWCHVSRNAVRCIERLSIRGSYPESHPVTAVLCRDSRVFLNFCDWTMNLRELRLNPAQHCAFTALVKTSHYFNDDRLFPKLNKLALQFTPSRSLCNYPYRMKTVEMAVDYINEILRLTAKLEDVSSWPVYDDIKGKSCMLDIDVFFWQPPHGKTFATWWLEKGILPRKQQKHRNGRCRCYFCKVQK